ncbi:AAA family ATPase, partial [Actinomadura bangladeshensis]|nr:AAA family ATPase [Actinomadura bangladeshensis]
MLADRGQAELVATGPRRYRATATTGDALNGGASAAPTARRPAAPAPK